MRLPQFIAAILFIFACSPAHAADFSPGPDSTCQLRMTGQVIQGDFERFKSQSGVFRENVGGSTEGNTLCVSGPGGAIGEALKIGALLYEKGISTRIEPGQTCISSCSLIFMMGTVYWPEGDGNGKSADRRMHVTSRLGFHRPELLLKTDRVFQADDLGKSFDLAVLATLELVRLANLGNGGSTMLLPDLIQEMFTHKGQDLYFVETTGQTARWGIQAEGFHPPKQMDPRSALLACDNIATWQLRYKEQGIRFAEAEVSLIDETEEGPIYRVIGPYGGEFPFSCLVQLRRDWISACGSPGDDPVFIGGAMCRDGEGPGYRGPEQLSGNSGFDLRALLPPATLLSEANAEARRIEARAMAYLASTKPVQPMSRLRMACSSLAGPVQVTNVETFVNMRSKPGFSGAVVDEVAKGAPLVPVDNYIYWSDDETDMDAECESLCRAAGKRQMSGGELEQLNQCFDANRFWYAVKIPKGENGFISGKFLRNYVGDFDSYRYSKSAWQY